MHSTPKFESVWDALIDNPDDDLKKRSDYFILIWARLNGKSGNEADKAERFGLSVNQVRDLTNGEIDNFNLSNLFQSQKRLVLQ